MTDALREAVIKPLAMTVGASDVRVWGMTSQARLARTFQRLGLAPTEAGAAPRDAPGVLVVNVGWIYDEAVIRALSEQPGAVLVDAAGRPVAAHVTGAQVPAAAAWVGSGDLPPNAAPVTAIELSGAYNHVLRKREPPILEPLTEGNVRQVEARLFQGSYKGVTDLVTKYLWPAPARVVTRWCALAGVTPNQVTLASLVLVLVAMYLFWTGHFGWGLVAGWVMTFLDTVDGKLARVTLNASVVGDVLDHGIDLIHPPFWWWAWIVGVQAGPHPLPDVNLVLAIVVGGYVLQRVLEGVFIQAFKLHVHAWRPFDSFFRLITARRNPNLLLLTGACLFGRPDIGMLLVAGWTAISLLVHAVQILQAAMTPRGTMVSWLAG
ncbi:MAG: phosphatidylglycerophosphate synthase [Phenylobacterium sp.]|nr:phosphatidylglycerophosphate synthase [Phenylobacterium sp.]